MFLSVRESCLILLQTIPDSIDMEIFERTLVSKFPEILSYHDLHIWQLSANKYVSTVHITFQSPKLYAKIIDDVRTFFSEQGITIVTIQPEFQDSSAPVSMECLVQCHAKDCMEKVCCRDSRSDLNEISITPGHNHSNHQKTHTHKKPKELKISSLLKINKLTDRSQSVNNINNGITSTLSSDECLKKTNSDWQVQHKITNGGSVLKSSTISLNPNV